jgi:hypothetical protein
MADYRQIHTCIWKDSWFLELGSDHKLLFIYLFSNERANLTGLYDLSVKVMVFETDLDKATIQAGLDLFAADGKVHYENGMLWVPSLMRHNAKNVTSPRIQAHIRTVISNTRNCDLKTKWIAYYNSAVDPQYRIDILSIPYPELDREHEQEQEHDHEQEHEHVAADAPSATADPPVSPSPIPFKGYQGKIEAAKGKRGGRQAVVHRMIEDLYPGLDPPDYGYIVKTAKRMGGFTILAEWLWRCNTLNVKGDVLAYVQAAWKDRSNGNRTHNRTTNLVEQATGWIDEPEREPLPDG